MSLVSFAQNQEDIMLWRALRHVRDGFYVDIGAADPADLSVTKTFYDQGWHGINVEPSTTYFAALNKARRRDINLRVGVGREPGLMTFFHVIGTGLSTFDREIAMDHQAHGWDVVEETVETLTLAEICQRHRPQGPIHFLKIDVEGAEGDVLAGADFVAFRPWIVLVEATLPLSPEESYAEWDAMLTSNCYSFVWFDGLNRFYLSDELKADLAEYFHVQPNIFDNFTPMPELVRRVEQTEQELQAARAEVMQTTHAAAEALQRTAQVAGAVQQTSAALTQQATTLAQQSTLMVEAQRQNADVAHQRDALAQELSEVRAQHAAQLSEVRAQHAALSVSHENVRAALAEAERLREESQATLGGANEKVRQLEESLGQLRRRSLPSLAKDFARRAFHRGVRLFLWLPGGRLILLPVRAFAPKPVEWLALRYRAYEESAAARRQLGLADVPPTLQTPEFVRSSCTDATQMPAADLSQEETRVYHQLSTSGFAAAVSS